MLQTFKNSQGSIILRFKLLNSSVTTGAGLTGLTSASSGLIISAIADNEATTTAYTVAGSNVESITTLGTYAAPTSGKCRFKEVDSTNHKGLYELQLADARFSVSNAKSLIVSLSGATNLVESDFLVQLQKDDPYVAKPANADLLSIDGSGRVDVIKVAGTTQTAKDIGAAVPAAAAGASGGILISGSNAGTTTLGALTITGATTHTGVTTFTGNVALAAGLTITQSTLNGAGISVTGNGTGEALLLTGGATGNGATITAGATSGHGIITTATGTSFNGLRAVGSPTTGEGLRIIGGSTSGAGMRITTTSGHGIDSTATGTTMHGMLLQGGATTSDGLRSTGGGVGMGIRAVGGGGTAAHGIQVTGGSASGNGINITTTSGHGISAVATGTTAHGIHAAGGATTSHGINAVGGGVGHGLLATSGAGATGDGLRAVAASTNGSGITGIKTGTGSDLNTTVTPLVLAKTTNITGFNDIAATAIVSSGAITTSAGAVSTVTNLTNLPSIPANWLTAAGIAAGALNGKGDWNTVAPPSVAAIATGVWQDTTASDFTTALSIGKSVMNGVALGTGLTINGYTGNTPQTGDNFARIGAAGAGLTALGDTRIANLDAAVTTRMATYTQPTGFLAATFPGGTIANTTNITAGTIAAVTTVNGLAAGVITAASIAASALNGKGDWNIGKTGYTLTQAFPANFADLSIVVTTGLVNITQAAADKAWGTAARVLTAGTNIVLAKGTGVTGFNDPTVGAIADQVWEEAIVDHSGTAGSTAEALATATAPSAAAVADAVWDELLSGHVVSGSSGEALAAAGTAGDPWTTALPGAYGAGTAGKIVGDNINATIASRMASYTQPTGFLAATFPTGTIANTTNLTAGTVAAVTGAVGSVTGLTASDVGAIKAKTDQFVFTVANQVDANALTGGGLTAAGVRSAVGLASANLDTQLDALPTAIENADAMLDRDMATGVDSGSTTVRTPRQALRFLRNKWAIVAGTLTVTKENDVTTSWDAAVTGTAGADPVTNFDPTGP